MDSTFPQLEVDQLTVQQRLDLIAMLWDSIPDSSASLPIPLEHRDELERRLTEANEHPEAGIPWEQVYARLRQRP